MGRFHFQLSADYFQFYIQDEPAEGDLSESWTEETVARLLAVAPGTVGVGTGRNTNVPVSVEVLDAEPDSDLSSWGHVTECSLDVSSGRMVIAGCTDSFRDAARIEVDPGTYHARISYGSLDTVSEDGLEGNDHYRVKLWRASGIEPCVLKQRPG